MEYRSKIAKELKIVIVMFGLNEAVDQFYVANSVCWYCHVLTSEDGHVLNGH